MSWWKATLLSLSMIPVSAILVLVERWLVWPDERKAINAWIHRHLRSIR